MIAARSRAGTKPISSRPNTSVRWHERLANIVDWGGFPEMYFAIDEAGLRRQATARLLQTDLAIRLYQHDRGSLPPRLDDLIPAYLSTLPLDPYSGRPLTYRTNGD